MYHFIIILQTSAAARAHSNRWARRKWSRSRGAASAARPPARASRTLTHHARTLLPWCLLQRRCGDTNVLRRHFDSLRYEVRRITKIEVLVGICYLFNLGLPNSQIKSNEHKKFQYRILQIQKTNKECVVPNILFVWLSTLIPYSTCGAIHGHTVSQTNCE